MRAEGTAVLIAEPVGAVAEALQHRRIARVGEQVAGLLVVGLGVVELLYYRLLLEPADVSPAFVAHPLTLWDVLAVEQVLEEEVGAPVDGGLAAHHRQQ